MNLIGWVSLHRQFLKWEWYTDNNTKALFIHCLLKANNAPGKFRGITINRGQFFTSIQHLSYDLKLSSKQIRGAMDKLRKTGEIVFEGASNGTMLTICKYEEYQMPVKHKGQATGQAEGKPGASEGRQLYNNIIKQQKEFKTEVESFAEKYDIELLTAFYSYWSEPNRSKTKMRMELEKTWETKRRLITWYNRSKK